MNPNPMRGLQNQALANERGTLCVDAIFDRITMQNPVKLVYCCITPHIRLVFYVKIGRLLVLACATIYSSAFYNTRTCSCAQRVRADAFDIFPRSWPSYSAGILVGG